MFHQSFPRGLVQTSGKALGNLFSNSFASHDARSPLSAKNRSLNSRIAR